MTSRIPSLSVLAFLLSAAGAAASVPSPSRLTLPEGSVVIDGGDLETAALGLGSSLDALPVELPEYALAYDPVLMASASDPSAPDPEPVPAPRPMAFEYSDGYRTRLKVHKIASFATLPLFIAQYAVGQKLYDGNASDSTRSLHGALAASTAVLFGVNTVTGGWNLYEGRKDPNHSKKRMIHGILMLVADAGFVATGMTAPDDDGEGGVSRSTHRTIALSSMGVATVSYLMMLIH
jgi:hypothetical protein